jgi:hypothetical protein
MAILVLLELAHVLTVILQLTVPRVDARTKKMAAARKQNPKTMMFTKSLLPRKAFWHWNVKL